MHDQLLTFLGKSSKNTSSGSGDVESGRDQEPVDLYGNLISDDVEFFDAIGEEIKKINSFYLGKISELQVL